jgi:hypothetical protein
MIEQCGNRRHAGSYVSRRHGAHPVSMRRNIRPPACEADPGQIANLNHRETEQKQQLTID